jgi:hypothetical protein
MVGVGRQAVREIGPLLHLTGKPWRDIILSERIGMRGKLSRAWGPLGHAWLQGTGGPPAVLKHLPKNINCIYYGLKGLFI